ncbi:glycosyl hydrolase [Apiospora phragmitis]|uniref:Glycosyl hydrolase n=1 Tax=Apiospora phragmitis TaxID=2905665 RepID=A0ABR1WQX0_9PEZI
MVQPRHRTAEELQPILVAVWLANRVPADKKAHYANWAVRAWDGFRRSPMYVSDEHYVTAGISVQTCQLGKKPHGYTYSNGALVSGLVALSIATGHANKSHPNRLGFLLGP